MSATASVTQQPPIDRGTVIRLADLAYEFAKEHENDAFSGASLKALFEHLRAEAKRARNIEKFVRHLEQKRLDFSRDLTQSAGQRTLRPTGAAITEHSVKKTLKLFPKPDKF